jgi:hypothetical protein
MNALVKQAIVGTGRGPVEAAQHPTDVLFEQFQGNAERRLLWQAGAIDLYETAGVQPRTDLAFEPALATDAGKALPAPVAALMAGMLTRTPGPLWHFFLQRLQRAGYCIPPHGLLQVLNIGQFNPQLRPSLAGVLSERARWLAAQHPHGKWVNRQDHEDLSVDQAQVIWNEGTAKDRLLALMAVRLQDPATARAWLEKVWPKEKAETRGEFLQVLKEGLSAADEPFLQTLETDRSLPIRYQAAIMRATLPGSALRARACAIAGPWLSVAGGALQIQLPADFDKSWEALGIAVKPPAQTGAKQFWFEQLIALVPPTFWESTLGITAPEFAEHAVAIGKDAYQLLLPVVEAVHRHLPEAVHWVEPVWSACIRSKAAPNRMALGYQVQHLIPQMPVALRVQHALKAMQKDEYTALELLRSVPSPWPAEIAALYVERLIGETQSIKATRGYLFDALESAVLALDSSNFDRLYNALLNAEIPETHDYYRGRYRKQFLIDADDRRQIETLLPA